MRDRDLIRSEFLERDLIVIDVTGFPHVEARADIRNQCLILETLLDLRDVQLGHKVKVKPKKRIDGRKGGLMEMRFGRESRKPKQAPGEAK
jgi:hypothetical protein